ncbi:hypothetical protein HYH03_017872 [Edaphochlamys debaryana]|uniref:Uncharacterized protein n=1 Tax=Edaphochlamys debaryana TaxID=47281 RepID=A0A835XLN6_9CHLO|nr:hypothetical protein HYH03_017872 [Edaphochlamys debaryana]|eukprot:KAG2483275.1 hypothetical protein HYH03_017872 [Edaphochlamys debaryana]
MAPPPRRLPLPISLASALLAAWLLAAAACPPCAARELLTARGGDDPRGSGRGGDDHSQQGRGNACTCGGGGGGLVSVGGAQVLSPEGNTEVYRDAHVAYWRTVMGLPFELTPANPDNDDRSCPRVPSGFTPGGKPTYLITGSLFGGATQFPIRRSCSLPRGGRVILNIANDAEWFAPPIDYSQSSPFLIDPYVRLTATSLLSLAQTYTTVNASDCVSFTLNNETLRNIASFYHVGKFVNDMDISPGFFEAVAFDNQIAADPNDEDQAELLDNGIRNTDFGDAGWYLIFPRGMPQGTHRLSFGFRACEAPAAGRDFWRYGTNTLTGECFPDPVACRADLVNVGPLTLPDAQWEYTITVK